MQTDRRVAAYLGRVLTGVGPIGTCFQVAPGVLVTAWHVLDAAAAGEKGDILPVDPLGRGPARQAQVQSVDPVHDLAVLVTGDPLEASVKGLAASDEVIKATAVLITGVADVVDPGHNYRYLDASGRWAGGTTRDDRIALGRVTSSDVMRGMSGAPVLAGELVAGVVSARYNSMDGWGRDSVWVARTEDLVPLLNGTCDVGLARQGEGASPKTDIFAIVDALLNMEAITDEGGRREVLRQLPPNIAAAIPYHAVPRLQVLAMVRTCLGYPDGLKELLDVIRAIEPDSNAMRQLDATAARAFPHLLGYGLRRKLPGTREVRS